MWLFLLTLLIAIILFVPIPFMFKVTYVDNILNIYLYKKLLFSSKKNNTKKQTKNKKRIKNKEKTSHKNSSKNLNVTSILSSLYNNPYKPKLKFWLDFEYSLTDAAYTALLYGVAHSTFATISNILNSFIKLDIKTFKVFPLFNNTNIFFINVKGIFYINLAQIIYILFLYFRNIKK